MAKQKKASAQIKVTLKRSTNGRVESHKACVRGLGLRKRGSSAIVEDTPCTRGMINKVGYLLEVEQV